MNRPEILVFGELLWDLLPDGEVLGGAPANCAYRINAFGLRVALISRVGNDERGKKALQILKDSGISSELIQIDRLHQTGTAGVELSATGSPRFVISRNAAYDFIEPERSLVADLSATRMIIFGTLCQRSKESRKTLYEILSGASNALKLLDINLRPECYSCETVQASLEAADILKLNDDEVLEIGEMFGVKTASLREFSSDLCKRFKLKTCLVTRGAHGVYALRDDGEELDLPGIKIRVVDTIGAGDAFTAGFASRYIKGADFSECCAFGNRAGALAASKKGGMAAFAPNEIDRPITN